MKNLITTMAAVTVLMIFVLQFAANQALCGRFFVSDMAVANYSLRLMSHSADGFGAAAGGGSGQGSEANSPAAGGSDPGADVGNAGAGSHDALPTEAELSSVLSQIWNCDRSEVKVLTEKEGGKTVVTAEAPVKDVIVCGRLLGISPEENRITYRKRIGISS